MAKGKLPSKTKETTLDIVDGNSTFTFRLRPAEVKIGDRGFCCRTKAQVSMTT